MARAKLVPIEKEIIVEHAVEEEVIVEEEIIVEEPTDLVDEVIIEEPTKEVAPPTLKNVKIKALRRHSCVIGGVRYNFEQGKQYNVPLNVKEVLSRANMLLPI